MPPNVSASFRAYLKANTGMKLLSDAAVIRITYEGISNFESLADFDKKSIESLPRTCKETIIAIAEDVPNGIAAEPEVPGSNLSSISVRRLIVAMHAVKFYSSIGRTVTTANMHWKDTLSTFKQDYEFYEDLAKQDDPDVPLISDKHGDQRVIKWSPIFIDCLSRTFTSKGPLSYVLRDNDTVPAEATDPLEDNDYFGRSGGLQEELIARLPHTGSSFKTDNKTVFMKIEKASRGTSVESTVKTFARLKNGRGAFLALIANHAGDQKYRAILKKRQHMLQNVKWNGRSFPLETHISNQRQAIDDMNECASHITVSVPDQSQRVELLIDSINCADSTLQAAIGLVRANTNNMRQDFELAATSMIEVDPYKRSQNNGGTRQANVSAIDFSAGRGNSGVDLRWHHAKEFRQLSSEEKDELTAWMKTQDGKKAMRKSRNAHDKTKKRKADTGNQGKDKGNNGNWKKKFKKAIKTADGLKTVMSVLADEEKTNTALISALHSSQTPTIPPTPATTPTPPPTATVSSLQASFPATTLKLQSILKK